MTLVLRRAAAAKGLLLAALGATLLTVVLLTGLASYSRAVVDAGARSAIAAAPPQERSVLLRGPLGGPDGLAARDAAVRARFAAGLDGLPVRVRAAGYAAGRQLTGPTGTARPDADGVVFASVAFLDGLTEYADLTAGSWPRPAGTPVQAALAEAAAAVLGVTVGDRVPVTDRFTGRVADVAVTGLWRPRDPGDVYWQLSPTADGAAAGAALYGPFVVTRADFTAGFATSASAAWLVAPDLTGVDPDRLRPEPLRRAVATLGADVGFDTSAVATSRLDQLADRLRRADLVGRSAVLTPLLLMIVLGGYALLLIALLLTEDRRAETALLRARGAARGQLARLAAREAALLVLPAAVLAPPLAGILLRYAPLPASAGNASHRLAPDALGWLVAGSAAAGCAIALLLPALRAGGSYVAELGGRSRPATRSVLQRAGVDVALAVAAVLGWLQLREYGAPLAAPRGGGLGIDPVLAVAPALAVLAGAVLALRVVTPLSRLAERRVHRSRHTAAVLGTWQASRRPHAGPVLLLALAIGVSTLAWCLAGTAGRSVADQADHQVGADLRLVDQAWFPPAGRAEQLAALPGATAVLPAWRQSLALGAAAAPATLLALDSGRAQPVLRLRPDLAGGSAPRLLSRLAAAGRPAPALILPAGSARVTGVLRTGGGSGPVRSEAVFHLPDGSYRAVPLGAGTAPGTFAVAVPAGAGRLVGFLVGVSALPGRAVNWQIGELRADGTPVPLAGRWRAGTGAGVAAGTRLTATGLSVSYQGPGGPEAGVEAVQLAVTPAAPPAPVPVLATPAALTALGVRPGGQVRLPLVAGTVDARVVGTVTAVPGGTAPAALLADLPALAAALFQTYAVVPQPQEWWIATSTDGHPAAVAAAGRLDRVQVLDRRAAARGAAGEPYGAGARGTLFAAALAAVLLAGLGLAVDVRATARRRATELAVLHTLGASPRMLARSLVAEHGLLAGIGVLVGLAVGIGVAAATAPLVVLTPAAGRPVPAPLLAVPWAQVTGSAAVLLVLAAGLSALVAATMRRRLAAARLRVGADA